MKMNSFPMKPASGGIPASEPSADREHGGEERTLLRETGIVIEFLIGVVRSCDVRHHAEHRE